MNTHNIQSDLDDLIKEASLSKEEPSDELNNVLKTKVRQKEALLLEKKNKRKISLWYLPMLLNCFLFFSLDIIARIFIQNNFTLQLINGVCIYFIATGIVLTIAGMKLSNLKTTLTFELN